MSMRLRAAVIWRQKGGQKRLLRDDACVVCARHAAPDIERVGRACRRRLFGSGSITDRVVAKEDGIGECGTMESGTGKSAGGAAPAPGSRRKMEYARRGDERCLGRGAAGGGQWWVGVVLICRIGRAARRGFLPGRFSTDSSASPRRSRWGAVSAVSCRRAARLTLPAPLPRIAGLSRSGPDSRRCRKQ